MIRLVIVYMLTSFVMLPLNGIDGLRTAKYQASVFQKKGEINILTPKEVEEGWELLFDGKSLNSWKKFNGGETEGWKVVDGILYNSGVGSDHGGDIITKEEFGDFELSLEWNISPQSNSGIFIRVQENVTDAIYKTGPEYQLSDDKGIKRKRNKNQFSAACYAMYEPVGGEVNPTGEWNTSKIVVKGPYVEHWLNGVKVLHYNLWSEDWVNSKNQSKWADEPYYGIAKVGHIGLQDHGGLTSFRNIKIKKL